MSGLIAMAALMLPAVICAALVIYDMAEFVRAHRAHRGQR